MPTREHAGVEVGSHGRKQWRDASPSLRVNASKHSPTRHIRVDAPRTLLALIAIGDDTAVMNVRDFDVTRNRNQQRHQQRDCHILSPNVTTNKRILKAPTSPCPCSRRWVLWCSRDSRRRRRRERSRAFGPSGTPKFRCVDWQKRCG